MKYLRALAFTTVLVLGLTSVGAAQNMVRKVDSFDFLVDYSGSMMMKSLTMKEVKIDLAKKILTNINSTIPNLGYFGSLHTFGPVETIQPTIVHNTWNAPTMAKAISSLRNDQPIFGRLTPMGDGLHNLAPEYAKYERPTAVIMVSDGMSNIGNNPVSEADWLLQTQSGLCLHVISLADTPEGKEVLDRIAALDKCTVYVQGSDLLASQANVDKFVRDVFYTTDIIEGIVLRGVNFAFDSSTLDRQARGILDEAAKLLMEKGTPATLQGWTDSIGTDAYNKGLSQRRADSVRQYLIQKGVPASNLKAVGMGKSFKYDNSTPDGRYLNRRTEILF